VQFIKMLPEKNKRDFVLNDEQYGCLMEELPRHIKPIVQLAWVSGARRDKIMSLKWAHVDLDKKLIQIQETKNDEPRTIPLKY
jgi:integrase